QCACGRLYGSVRALKRHITIMTKRDEPAPESLEEQGRCAEANARLSAAGPDLLDALEAVEWAAEDEDRVPVCPWCDMDMPYGHDTWCKLAAALRKARGES